MTNGATATDRRVVLHDQDKGERDFDEQTPCLNVWATWRPAKLCMLSTD
jgi:hypothetical protein